MARGVSERQGAAALIDLADDAEADGRTESQAVGTDGVQIAAGRARLTELRGQDDRRGPHGVARIEDPALSCVEFLLCGKGL